MKRYLKVYWKIIQINIALLFAYRANLYNSILITLGWGIVSVGGVFILTSRATHVYSWSRTDLYLLTGIYSIVVGLFHMLFSTSMERFARTISLGNLDSYLLTPIDSQLYLSTKMFRPVSSLRLMIGIVFTGFILHQLHITLTFFSIGIGMLFIMLGIVFLYSLWFSILTLLIWNPNLANLIDFLYIINNLGRYPPEMLTVTRNIILYLFIPLALVAAVPAKFLLGKITLSEITIASVSTIGLFFFTRLFWKFALKSYSSASGSV